MCGINYKVVRTCVVILRVLINVENISNNKFYYVIEFKRLIIF